MLDLARIDLAELSSALEDHSYESRWYMDRATGELVVIFENDAADESLEDRDLLYIEPLPSHEAYEDLTDFVDRVSDPRARDLLQRAIEGRGAFRRFKDTLFEFPELRASWFEFHDVRMHRRAVEWLLEEAVVDEQAARDLLRSLEEAIPPASARPMDAIAIAKSVAIALRDAYGDRLIAVRLFGSWARGDAHPESDIDLLVVLDRVDSWLSESKQIDEILWRHSFENSTVVSSVIVSREENDHADEPLLRRALIEGVTVG